MNMSKIAFYTESGDKLELNPSETINCMFEHTDNNGILYIPKWPSDDNMFNEKEQYYKCSMNWSEHDKKTAEYSFNALYSALKSLAEKYDLINSDEDVDNLPLMLKNVWNTYIREFDIGDIDEDYVYEIMKKMDNENLYNAIGDDIKAGAEITTSESDFYYNYKDAGVSDDENEIVREYRKKVKYDIFDRVGMSYGSYDLVMRAKRLYKLLYLDAPEIIINNEANLLAQAVVIYGFCKNLIVVDDVE